MAARGGPDLHLRADGVRVEPDEPVSGASFKRYVFRLAVPSHTLHVVSRSAVPHALGLGPDRRRLGVLLCAVEIARDAVPAALPLDSPDLFEGLHEFEPGLGRWTDGCAALPLPMLGRPGEPIVLTLVGRAMPDYGGSAQADRDAELFRGFESLGARCDLAFAQRHFGAETKGLLRWASTTGPQLLRGLQTRFEGLGDPAMTRLEWQDEAADYRLADPRYLSAHAFKGARCADPQAELELRLGICAGWRLLRRKLLADIARADRIFVFAASGEDARPSVLRRLSAVLRRIGPATLLGVVEGGEAGRVRWIGDGLLVGHVDRLPGEAGPFEQWREVCLSAMQLSPPARPRRDGHRSGTPGSPPAR